MIARLEERIQQTCDDIVDQALAKGEGDFVTLCAAELPLIVIAELMGVPIEDRHKVFDWSNRMVGGDDPEYAASTEEQRFDAAQEMWAYANELAAEQARAPAGRHRHQAHQPGRGAATSSTSSSSTCSSCCSRSPATRPPATRSPAACTR